MLDEANFGVTGKGALDLSLKSSFRCDPIETNNNI